jgi:hypothetical protein
MDTVLIYILQLLCILVILTVIYTDVNYNKLREPYMQVIISIIVLSILIFVDALSGFLLTCSMLIIYYKLFNVTSIFSKPEKTDTYKKDYLMDYISPMHLKKAQDNIWNEDKINIEHKGFIPENGMLYGIQGLDSDYPGYSCSIGKELNIDSDP